MKVEYSYKDGRCEAAVSDDADWQLFNGVADAILRNFKGTVLERVDGLEERYWDIEMGTEIVTLHLQHYLGILLFSQDQGTNELIREIGRYLETIEPQKMSREWLYIKDLFRTIRWTGARNSVLFKRKT